MSGRTSIESTREPHAYVNAVTVEVADESSGSKGTCAAVQVANRVVAALGERIYRAARERQLQDGIETVLRENGFRVDREFRLSDRDRPDFLINGLVAVEVKMRASGSAVLSQLARYASDRRVEAIVVATPRLSSLSGVPSQILGVPVRVIGLPGPGLSL